MNGIGNKKDTNTVVGKERERKLPFVEKAVVVPYHFFYQDLYPQLHGSF